MFLADPL